MTLDRIRNSFGGLSRTVVKGVAIASMLVIYAVTSLSSAAGLSTLASQERRRA